MACPTWTCPPGSPPARESNPDRAALAVKHHSTLRRQTVPPGRVYVCCVGDPPFPALHAHLAAAQLVAPINDERLRRFCNTTAVGAWCPNSGRAMQVGDMQQIQRNGRSGVRTARVATTTNGRYDVTSAHEHERDICSRTVVSPLDSLLDRRLALIVLPTPTLAA